MSETTKEKRPRKGRRNYGKDLERLTFYVDTIIYVKDEPANADNPTIQGELKALREIQRYIGEFNGKK